MKFSLTALLLLASVTLAHDEPAPAATGSSPTAATTLTPSANTTVLGNGTSSGTNKTAAATVTPISAPSSGSFQIVSSGLALVASLALF